MKNLILFLVIILANSSCKSRDEKIEESISLYNAKNGILKLYKYHKTLKIDSISEQKEMNIVADFALFKASTLTELSMTTINLIKAERELTRLDPTYQEKYDPAQVDSIIKKAEGYAYLSAKLKEESIRANSKNFNFYHVRKMYSKDENYDRDTIVEYYISNDYNVIPQKDILKKYIDEI